MANESEITVGIILGHGISRDGNLPPLVLQRIRKAVELYKQGIIHKLIFSGKWSWRCRYTPPITEAGAGKMVAETLGVPEKDIYLEEESNSTISNLFLVEEKILLPHGFRHLIFINEPPLEPRLKLDTEKCLGDNYTISFVDSGYVFPVRELAEIQKKEQEKYNYTKNLFDHLGNLPHLKIYEAFAKDLAENFIKKING
ncbi:YdcF family protein [Patescibacteria group bacterium]|nr:YdcF family protein [Patescibacteria group bacterium]